MPEEDMGLAVHRSGKLLFQKIHLTLNDRCDG